MLILTQSKPTHRRYQPQTLYQLSFEKLCISLWSLSPLPSLHAEAANNYIFKDITEQYKDYSLQSRTILENIEKKLQCSDKMPFHLRMKIMCIVSEIDNDMCEFAFVVAQGLVQKSVENIQYCIEHVTVTENFTICMTKSLCNILRTSKFGVTFTKPFLACYCVKRNMVLEVLEELARMERRSRQKGFKKGSRAACELAMEMIEMEQHTKDLMTGKLYWKKYRRQNSTEYASKNLRYATDFQYVAVVGSIDALKYHCDIICQKLESHEIPQHIFECAKYIFQVGTCTAEKIMFFYKKLNSEMRKRLLQQEFLNIFITFLSSWRYRHLCIVILEEDKETLDSTTVQSILKKIVSMEIDKYQYYEILTIVKELWNLISGSFKADKKILSYIPDLMLQRKDINTDNILPCLAHLLKDNTPENQEEILGCIIFKLVSTSQEKHIQTCLNIGKDLGIKVSEGKEYLTRQRLKNLLINDTATSTKTEYHKISQYICGSKEEERKFKEDLLQDEWFIVDFLVNSKKSLFSFLSWALEEESLISAYKTQLIKEKNIDKIYQKRLIQSTSIYDTDMIFSEEMLNLNEPQVTDIKDKVKKDSNVLYLFLLNSLQDGCKDLKTFFESFSLTREEETKLMRQFLYLPETKIAIYDLIMDLQNFDLSFLSCNEGARLMLQWHKFITDMVKPYTDINAYEAMLLENRDAIFSACLEKIKLYPKFTSRYDENAIKMIVDIKLRCFSRLCYSQDLGSALHRYLKCPIMQDGPFMFLVAMNSYRI